jgi:hypothetical protein
MNFPDCEQYNNNDIPLFEITNVTEASNYAKNFLNKLSLMRDKVELCDFRIDINDKQLLCHKFLLIAASDYFKAMFNGL